MNDQVCKISIEEKSAQFSAGFEGIRYYFCSNNCHKAFEEDPEAYVEIPKR